MDACLGVKRAHRQGVSRSRLPSSKDYIRIGIHAPYGTHQGTGVVSVDVDASDFAGAQSSRLNPRLPGLVHGREQVGVHEVLGRRPWWKRCRRSQETIVTSVSLSWYYPVPHRSRALSDHIPSEPRPLHLHSVQSLCVDLINGKPVPVGDDREAFVLSGRDASRLLGWYMTRLGSGQRR